jgi:sugar O-acyltransferase (sialic acid O-acetyltransferase NeuD family)
MIKSEILVPLLNANEPEARLVSVHVKEGQSIKKGDVLFTIETTKTASDIESPETGFVRLFAKEGDTLVVGFKIAVISEKSDDLVENLSIGVSPSTILESSIVGKMRITNPARTLADSLGLDLASLPTDRLVTEKIVRQMISSNKRSVFQLPPEEKPYLLLFGGGGHTKTIIDMVRQIGAWTIAGIVDDNLAIGNEVLGIPVLGKRDILQELFNMGIRLASNGVGGILDIAVRVRIFELLENYGFSFPKLIHPRSTVEPSASLGDGVQVFANAYIGSLAILHPRCMVNTNAVISHDCEIGAYTHIAPGALLAGQVQVGEHTLIGMGVTTTIGVRIGSGARIGNGAIILADVPDKMVVQAGRYWVGKA